MHPYAYNRMISDRRPNIGPDPAPADAEKGGAPPASPDMAQLMGILQTMQGNTGTGGQSGAPPFSPEMMRMMALMQAMRGGGGGMQSLLPLLTSMGGLPPHMQPILEAMAGGRNERNMMELLQGMLPPESAQLFGMLSAMNK